MSDGPVELPFDVYQRYRLVTDVLDQVRKGRERLHVLDVGGRTAILRRFLTRDRVDLVDVEASESAGLVLGDGARLPFADGSFDAVVSFDTLEHVPPAARADFVRECRRVAKRWVVIAGPYRTKEVERAEALLRAFLKRKLEQEHRYLEEHHHHGLPVRAEVEELLGELGGEVVSVGHASLERWLPLMCLAMYMDRDAPLRPLAERFYRFYNAALYASDHAPPVYRHAVVASLDGSRLPDAAELLAPPAAPSGSLEPVAHLVDELLAYDSGRDAVLTEWRRLFEVNQGLLADRDQHKQSLDEARAQLAQQKDVIVSLRADAKDVRAQLALLEQQLEHEREDARRGLEAMEEQVGRHLRELEELRGALRAKVDEAELLRTELQRSNEAAAEEADTLRADLEAHRGSLRDLEHALAAKREELALQRGEMERERMEQEAVAAALAADLGGHREALVGVRATLAEVEAELAAERAERTRLLDELAAERAASAEVAATYEADLAGHRGALERARRETEAARAETAAQGENARALEAEVARMHEVASAIQADLVAAQGALEGTQAELARERAFVEFLRAELRSRKKNLRRAVAREKPTYPYPD